MGHGYLLTTETLTAPKARAIVTFAAGPWRQMIALPEGTLTQTQAGVEEVVTRSALPQHLMLFGLPPLPPVPKILLVEPSDLLAIALVTLRPGQVHTFTESLSAEPPQGSLTCLVPHHHVLLDISDSDEAALHRRVGAILDSPAVVAAQVGLAMGSDVSYPQG